TPDTPEVVVRDAKRRQRRRWLRCGAVLVVVAGAADGGIVVFGSTPPARGHHTRGSTTTSRPAPGSRPAGAQPENPGALAVAPTGGLYVADDSRNQIFERVHGGAFRVAAGDGKRGFTGDGGPAARAEINDPGAMAVAANGTLYFTAGVRVRAVLPTGTITTIAGDGRNASWVSNGTPALDASLLGATALTVSPSGQLYIATGDQVLALEPDGTLMSVLGNQGPYGGIDGLGGPAVDASADGAAGLAFDSAGNLFVFGFDTKSILMIAPDGLASLVPGTLYPRGSGGLVSTPGGAVLAMSDTSIVRLTPQGEHTVFAFPAGPSPTDSYLGVKNVAPAGIAISPDATTYFDTDPGDGYSDEAIIASISPRGHGTLLWRRGRSASRRAASSR
ncbi:MAG: hypothetical protein ACRDWE_00855, partial [Acidimicrobiales bacterium]